MSIRQALEKLSSKDDLQKLFVEHLNFAPASGSVKHVLSAAVGENVRSAEIIARQDNFKVIFCTLYKLLKGTERPVIDQFSKYNETAPNMVIFSDEECHEFHFTNLRSIKSETGQIKIIVRPFRRIVIGPNERLRTADERISLIQLSGEESAIEVQTKCDHAFDVETVSRDFYKDFVHYYKEFRRILMEENQFDQQDADIHTQTIFNRFFFLYFIQKKGYLNNESQFLIKNLIKIQSNNYYHHFILSLFQKLSIPDFRFNGFEQVPFLNGGLFEFSDDEIDLKIPNSAFEVILIGLFEHYNFTVREDTEFEKEVAIDPEMMGTIFEKLILGLESKEFKDIPDPRRATGSFYTPKFIVAFMVKQSLLNDLTVTFKQVSRIKLKNLIFHLQTDDIKPDVLIRIRQRLCEIKIVDPAVGSGAYAVGILLKIVEMIEAIDRVVEPDKVEVPSYRYSLKKHIIENCIYGVDLQERAVALSHLRLWLSLIVDLQVENIEEISPLPNLDFHILCGDSLISQVAGYSYDIEKRIEPNQREIELIEKFRELKRKHETLPTQEAKEKSKQKIAKLKTNILVWFLSELKKKEEHKLGQLEGERMLFDEDEISIQKKMDLTKPIKEKIEKIDDQLKDVESLSAKFNWGLDFFDVLELRGGFDIVIANPPYGVKVSDAIRNEFGIQNKDSYGVFTVLGLRILKPGGTLCYIMSDTWQTIRTHKKLRDILLKETDAQYLISLPPDVFAATVNTGVHTLIKREQKHHSFAEKADNWLLAADFSPLKIRQPDGLWDSTNLETAFEMLIEVDRFDETKDGYTIVSDREMAIFAYRQKLIPRFSNHSFFITSPKLFGLMRDVGNVKNEMREVGESPVFGVDFNRKEIEIKKLSDIAKIKKGIDTGDNLKYVRVLSNVPERVKRGLNIVDENKILAEKKIMQLKENEKINGVSGSECFVPFEKGASSETDEALLANYYFPTPYYINWSKESVHELRESGTALRNSHYWFKNGITFSPAGIYAPLFRLNKPGIFSGMGSCIFPESINLRLLLGILCSKLAKYILRSIMQATVSTDTGTLLEFPTVVTSKTERDIDRLVDDIIVNQKKDSDYDYMTNEQIEIDRLVYEMYNLNDEDIQEVENWYFRRYPKLARVIEEKLKNKGTTDCTD